MHYLSIGAGKSLVTETIKFAQNYIKKRPYLKLNQEDSFYEV